MFGKSISATIILGFVFLLSACGGGQNNPGGSFATVSNIVNNMPNFTCDKSDPAFELPSGKGNEITQDLTIGPGCFYASSYVTIDNGAQLTIRPNTILQFDARTVLVVLNGNIVANGLPDQPIYFTAEFKTRNTAWLGIDIRERSLSFRPNIFNYTVIEYAGARPDYVPEQSASIRILDPRTGPGEKARTIFTNNVVRGSAGKYALLADKLAFFDKIENNIFYDNFDQPVSINANESFKINKSNRFELNGVGNINNKITITGTFLDVSSPESQPSDKDPNALPLREITWDNLGIPYLIEENINITKTVLRIEPGTTLEFESDAGLNINGSQSILISRGTATQPIVMTDADLQDNMPWRGLTFTESNSVRNTLDYTQVLFAGGPRLRRFGDPEESNIAIVKNSTVAISNSQLSNSNGYGLYLDSSSNLPGFVNNQLLNNSTGVAKVSSTTVHFLDASNTYGNMPGDSISIIADDLTANHTFNNLGIPYTFNTNLRIFGDVTIMPGTTMLFAANSEVLVSTNGTLRAEGTQLEPIILGDVTQLNNDGITPRDYWKGIKFYRSTDPQARNQFSYVTIDYAGAPLGLNPSAITLLEGSRLNMDNVNIQNTAPGSMGVYTDGLSTLYDNGFNIGL